MLHPPGSYELVPISQLFVGTVSLMMPPKSLEQDEELLASIRVDGVIEAIHATPRAPNREGVTHHRVDNGGHRLAAARIVGIEALWTKWNDPAWSRDELIRKMLAVESKSRVWDAETRQAFLVKLEAEEHRTVRQLAELTGWKTTTIHRALHYDDPDTGPAVPGEQPAPVPTPDQADLIYRAIVILRDALDAALDEDEPVTDVDATRRYRQYPLDLLRGLVGRHQAYLDGGKEGLTEYAGAHPFPADLYETEYGVAIPATEKWKEIDHYDQYGVRHPRR